MRSKKTTRGRSRKTGPSKNSKRGGRKNVPTIDRDSGDPVGAEHPSYDTPPSRSRFDGDLKAFPVQELADELKQCKIDIQCGPGPVTRDKIAAREENIRDELARRNRLTQEAFEREEAVRGKGSPKLPDATIQTVLSTREVLTEIERWRKACYTGGSDKKTKNVGDLVYEMQQTIEEWVNVLEEDGR